MQKRTNRLVVILVGFLLATNCDSKAVFDEYKSIPNQWHKDSVVSFNLKAPDTANAYNLYVNLRNNNAYKYSNLFLIVTLNHPNGKIVKDTLEYKMAKPNGELLGEGFSDVKENKLWYRGYEKQFNFDEEGEYTATIQHAMRNNGDVEGIENLEGITEIGFRIEQVSKQ